MFVCIYSGSVCVCVCVFTVRHSRDPQALPSAALVVNLRFTESQQQQKILLILMLNTLLLHKGSSWVFLEQGLQPQVDLLLAGVH